MRHQGQCGVGRIEHGTTMGRGMVRQVDDQPDILLQQRPRQAGKLLRATTSVRRSGEIPSDWANEKLAAAVPRFAVNNRLLSSLVVWPEPSSPRWTTVSA